MTRDEYLKQDIIDKLKDAIDALEGYVDETDPILFQDHTVVVRLSDVLSDAIDEIQNLRKAII